MPMPTKMSHRRKRTGADPRGVLPLPIAPGDRRYGEQPPAPESDDEDEVQEPEFKRSRINDRADEEDVADLYYPTSDEVMKKKSHLISLIFCRELELYGRGSIVRQANASRRDLNAVGLDALDLRTSKPDGSPWNFAKRSDRKMARDLIDQKRPDFIIGSPPCTACCVWNQHLNFKRVHPDDAHKFVKYGMLNLKFMCKVYHKQIDAN